MKKLRILLLMTITVLLAGCSDDNENYITFDEEFLSQTVWEGTCVVTNNTNQTISSEDILIQFFSTNEGQYSEKIEGTDYMNSYDFTYSVDGRVLMIEDTPLSDKLTLVEINKDKMVFIAYDSYKATITLTRKY